MVRFQKQGLYIPKTVHRINVDEDDFPPKTGPWFGRKIHHERGKDIQIFPTWTDVVMDNTRDFYTLFFKHDQELRAWVYKDRVFAWYQKHYRNPGLENYRNMEFRSEYLGDGYRPPTNLAYQVVKAVQTLKLDFGAVDILNNSEADSSYVILEVNSMPDISSMERISGIRLANIVHDWAEIQR
jgi:hypothetical protein